MTFQSCFIRVIEDAELPRRPDFGRPPPKRFAGDLKRPYSVSWVFDTQAWAKTRGLPIHYVDNCWLKVEMSAGELTEFLRDIYGADHQAAEALVARLRTQDRYIVEAEEF